MSTCQIDTFHFGSVFVIECGFLILSSFSLSLHNGHFRWNNEFLTDPTSSPKRKQDELHFGDLVTMTIVDVFETDCDGKLLSYCPTFDNRAIRKTDQRVERIRKGSTKIKNQMNIVANSQAALTVNKVSVSLDIAIFI